MENTFTKALAKLNELAAIEIPDNAWTEDRFVITVSQKVLDRILAGVSKQHIPSDKLLSVFFNTTYEPEPGCIFEEASVLTAFEAQTVARDYEDVQILHYIDALKLARLVQACYIAEIIAYCD